MPNAIFRPIRILIARSGIEIREEGWFRKGTVVATELDQTATQLDFLQQLEERLCEEVSKAECTKRPVRFVLADDLVRFMMVKPPKDATSLSDYRAAAALRFQTLYGESSTDWVLDAAWDAESPFLACAIPQNLCTLLVRAAGRTRIKITEIVPNFVYSWKRYWSAVSDGSWIGAVQQEGLTYGSLNGERLNSIRFTFVSNEAKRDSRWLSSQVSHEALRLGVPQPSLIQLCGSVPEAWLGKSESGLVCIRVDRELSVNSSNKKVEQIQ